MNDVVTLTTFAMEDAWKKSPEAIMRMVETEMGKVKKMQDAFDGAAKGSGRQPPEFVLSTLMIPTWGQSSYSNKDYIPRQVAYVKMIKETCERLGLKITVVNFYEKATEAEKQFLNNCRAKGSCADIMKNRSIIDNQNARHLNIDTNTIINDLKGFYRHTFGVSDAQQRDGINLSYYDNNYVSVHNKVVYTRPGSLFARALDQAQKEYTMENKANYEHKKPNMNTLYSLVFSKAAERCGLSSRKRSYFEKWDNLWHYNPANFQREEFSMSRYIVTAINMAWSQGAGKVDYNARLKGIQVEVAYKDQNVSVDFSAIAYIIKKHTNALLDEEARKELLAKSDAEFDRLALTAFFNHVVNTKDIRLIAQFLAAVPNTDLGKGFFLALYNGLTEENENTLKALINSEFKVDSSVVSPHDVKNVIRSMPESSSIVDKARKMELVLIADQLFDANKTKFKNSSKYKEFELKIRTKCNERGVSEKSKNLMQEFLEKEMENLSFMTVDELCDNLNLGLDKKIANIVFKYSDVAEAKLAQLSEEVQTTLYGRLFDDEASFMAELNNQIAKKTLYSLSYAQCLISELNYLAAKQPEETLPEEEIRVQSMHRSIQETLKAIKLGQVKSYATSLSISKLLQYNVEKNDPDDFLPTIREWTKKQGCVRTQPDGTSSEMHSIHLRKQKTLEKIRGYSKDMLQSPTRIQVVC